MKRTTHRTGDRVEYIGVKYQVGTIIAIHPGIDPYEIRWDDNMIADTRLSRGQFCPAMGYDQRVGSDAAAMAREGAQ